MLKYIISVLVLIAAVLAWMVWGIGVPPIYQEETPRVKTPHVLGNPDRSIENIHIFVFYFVPKDKARQATADWKKILKEPLDKIADFHTLQFQNRSKITYTLYPAAVIGLEETTFYENEGTSGGNPNALKNIGNELDQRVFLEDGDLYSVAFLEMEEDAYPVMFIFYEGVGAIGGVIYDRDDLETVEEIAQEYGVPKSNVFILDNDEGLIEGFFLVGRSFFRGNGKVDSTGTIAHELYHTIGAPDGYEILRKNGGSRSISTTQDIMGFGRDRSFESTFLSKEILKEFGL